MATAMIVACEKEEKAALLSLGAPSFSEITASDAIASSDVTICDESVIGWGFCYSTVGDPTIYSATVSATPGNGILSTSLVGLSNNTKYYVRAFATTYPTGVVYSKTSELIVGAVSVVE